MFDDVWTIIVEAEGEIVAIPSPSTYHAAKIYYLVIIAKHVIKLTQSLKLKPSGGPRERKQGNPGDMRKST